MPKKDFNFDLQGRNMLITSSESLDQIFTSYEDTKDLDNSNQEVVLGL